ncbi:trichohyalin [Biomphalaria pfeifferi]|uniref:Trichohyalin n=1 Tax=Biomphalaria pfeifferi TaxID=112525 RepID=A0AAD8ASE5_BIOPF|nr:trichohyalin [Biomphalaria pfeifferi]
MNRIGPSGAIHLAINKNLDGHGIFWQSKENNKPGSKKIDYKTRKLRHPIRQPNEEEILAQMEAQKEEEKKKFNKSNKDFIKQNRQRFKAKSQEQQVHPGTQIRPGTVTLTQNQLTALLASLGKTGIAADKDSPIKIKIDAASNKIEIEQIDHNQNRYKTDLKQVDKRHEQADSDSEAEIGIGALLEQQNKETKQAHQKKSSEHSVSFGNTEIVETKQESRADNAQGSDNLPVNVPWKHLTVAERKRLQWAREKAELQQEYNPWGKPGAGAPIRKQEDTETVSHPPATSHLAPTSNQNTARSFVDPEMQRKQASLEGIAREIAQLQREIQEMERRKKVDEDRILQELIERQKVAETKENVKAEVNDSRKVKVRDVQVDDLKENVKNMNQGRLERNQKNHDMKKQNENDDDRGDSLIEPQLDNSVKKVTRASPQLATVPATGLRLGDTQEELLSKKEMERKKWISELDQQREEQRIKKQLEKERDKTGVQDQWADRFVYHKTFEQVSPRHAQASQKMKEQSYAPAQAKQSEAVLESHAPPAAMRSSIVVGTGTLNDKRYDGTKAEEKKKWLQELEMQREEQRLAKLAQKERDKQEDGTWADRYRTDNSKLVTHQDSRQNEGVWMDPHPSQNRRHRGTIEGSGATEGIWLDPYPSDHKKLHPQSNEVPHVGQPHWLEPHRTNSAPDSILPPLQKETEQPSHIRGQGLFIDPVTRREQEEKRKAQLAHQAKVKAQIEEKERKKKEEKMKKMQEDLEEERKLQMERDLMNRQTEFEQKKLRDREELRQKQIDVLKSALDEAQEKAMEDKNVRRLQHLQQHGHDVSQLKAKYKASPRKKEFEMSSIPGLGYDVTETLNRQAQPASSPSYLVDLNGTSRFDPAELSDHNLGQTYSFDPYIENRVLTPSRFRDPAKPTDLSDSPRREFGTQTLELKDLKALLEKLPEDVQIEYKMKVEEALREKESVKHAPSRKVHTKVVEEVKEARKPKVKAVQSAPKEKTLGIKERPDWNQRRRKTVVKNSEKDPFYEEKREEAEARRLKRERQLMYLQELNRERIPNLSKSPGRSPRAPSPEPVKEVGERGRKTQKRLPPTETLKDMSPNVVALLNEDRKKKISPRSASPPIPSIKHKAHGVADPANDPYHYINSYLRNSQGDNRYGDVPLEPHSDEFVPFMRTTEVLDPSRADEPVEISRENSRMERARRAYYENLHPANKGKKVDIYQDSERETALKASQNLAGSTYVTPRQDMILQQLSSLKRTLMQRQKELEDYMLPSELEHEAMRG